jgi:mannose-6-phosphate isomerase-like protein (cupin superfamily)
MVPGFAASWTAQMRQCVIKASPKPVLQHKLSEEFYFLLEGEGTMEIDGEARSVMAGDAILIPPGAWHQITASRRLRFLCCCAPAYSHEDTYFA